MKLLFIHSPKNEWMQPQGTAIDIQIAGSLEEGLGALAEDRYDGVIVGSAHLGGDGRFREAYTTTQSPACHLLLSVSQDDEVPVETLMGGVDGFMEIPFQEETILELVQARRRTDTDILKQRTELRHQEEEIATLVAISNIIASNLEFVPLLAAIAGETSKALEAERTTIFLYHADQEEFEAAYAEALGANSFRMPSTQGIVGRVASTRNLLNVPDAYKNTYFNEEIDQQTGFSTRSVLCVPLISPIGDLIGVVECLNKNKGIFREADEQMLSMLSPLYAVAIENALLYQDLMEQVSQNEEMTAEKIQSERLAIVGRMANSVTKDFAEPMEEIVEHARRLGQENPTLEEKDETCQAIQRVVDHLVDRAQGLLDFSRGSLEVYKDVTRVGDLHDGINALLGGERASIHEGLTHDTSMMVDLEKIVRALSGILAALQQLNQEPFSVTLEPAGNDIAVVIGSLENKALQGFMKTLSEPFSGTAVDHDTGLRILGAQQVIHAHGGIFEQQASGLRVRIPTT